MRRGLLAGLLAVALTVVPQVSAARAQDAPPTPGPIESFSPIELGPQSGAWSVAATRIELVDHEPVTLSNGTGMAFLVMEQGAVRPDSADSSWFELATAGSTGSPSTPVGDAGEFLPGAVIGLTANASVGISATQLPAALLVVEIGEPSKFQASSLGVEQLAVVSEPFQTELQEIRLEISRQTLSAGATVGPSPTQIGRLLIVEHGATDVGLSQGMIRIGRSYGGVETIVAQPIDGSPVAEPDADQEADPEADPEADSEPDADIQPVVPALEGTVAGLAQGDIAVVSGDGVITMQGVGSDPAVVLVVSIVAADAG